MVDRGTPLGRWRPDDVRVRRPVGRVRAAVAASRPTRPRRPGPRPARRPRATVGATSWTPIGRPSGDVPPRTTAAGQPVRLWTSLYVSPNQAALLSPWRIAGWGIAGQTIRSASWNQRSSRDRTRSACSSSADSSSPGTGGRGSIQPRVVVRAPARRPGAGDQPPQPGVAVAPDQAIPRVPGVVEAGRDLPLDARTGRRRAAAAAASTAAIVSGVGVRMPLSVNATTRRLATSTRVRVAERRPARPADPRRPVRR